VKTLGKAVLNTFNTDQAQSDGLEGRGHHDTYHKTQLGDLLNAYQPPDLPLEQVPELQNMVSGLAKEAGMDQLPQF